MDEEEDPFLKLGLHVHRDAIEQQHACLFDEGSEDKS